MTTPTTNFSWQKPVVNADAGTWGTELNAIFDAQDAQVFLNAPKASPTFTGTVTGAISNWSGVMTLTANLSGTTATFSGLLTASAAATITGTCTATAFSGPLTGNVTGNVTGNASGSSGSCTGNAATATSATNQSGGSVSCTTFTASGAATTNGQLNVAAGLVATSNAQTTPSAVTFNATTMTLNCALSNVFTTTFTANVTVAPTLSNPNDGQTINWFITQDATGSRTMTWPASFKWPGGTVGVLSTAVNAVDLLVATYRAATGFWYATISKGFA